MTKSKLALGLSTIALMATATAGFAQSQDACGLGVNSVRWIGGDAGGSDISTVSDFEEQMALVLSGTNYVSQFELSSATDVRIEAEGRGMSDPMFELYDSAGTLLLTDDDSGGGTSAMVETSLDSGTYCVLLRSYDNSPMTSYLRIGRQEHERLTSGVMDEEIISGVEDAIDDALNDDMLSSNGMFEMPGLTCDSSMYAEPLMLGSSSTASVDEVPYWRFTIDEPMSVTITAEGDSADPYITLYDDYGGYLTENDDYDGLNSRIDMVDPLDPGDYCITMEALSDSYSPITVSVYEYDAEEVLMQSYASGEAAPPLDGSYPVTELADLTTRIRQDVRINGDVEWFSFYVPEGGLLLIEAITVDGGGDPFVYLYDDLGRQVGYNDDGPAGLDSMLATKITNGSYMLAVGDLNYGTGAPMRILLERYVPAR